MDATYLLPIIYVVFPVNVTQLYNSSVNNKLTVILTANNMATLNFYLDNADKQGKSFIMMSYLAGGQKFRHSVKLKIFPGKWLPAKQRLKENNQDDKVINSHIDNLENIIKEAQIHSLLSNNVCTQ